MADPLQNASSGSDPVIRVTWIGAVINVLLSVLKILAGLALHSIALLADGIHSLSDLVTDLAVVVGVRAGRRPADVNHPYGHGKFETLAAGFVSLALVGVGLGIIWKSGLALYADEETQASFLVILVALISVVSKEWLYWITRRAALAAESAAALANAWHHRSDALSSVAVMAGGGIALLGWPHGDQLAGVIVGAMVVFAGGRILIHALMELSEASVENRFYQALQETLSEEPEALSWHACKGRRVGHEIYLDCHVLVDPDMSVRVSHALTERIERRLRKRLQTPVNLLIHIEPYRPGDTGEA